MSVPLLALSLAFFAGVAVAAGFASATVELGVLVAVATVAGGYALRAKRRGAAASLLVTAVFALGLLRAADGPIKPGTVLDFAAGRAVTLTGVIESDPVARGGTQEFRVATELIAVGGESTRVDGAVLLRAPLGPTYDYGDRVRGAVTLRPTARAGGSDFEVYLAEQGIVATGFLRDTEVVATGAGDPLRAAVSGARADLDGALARALDEPLAGLAQGIVTGRRGSLDPDLRSDLNDSNLSHLVVISGGNVTLLAALIVAGTAWILGRRRAVLLALVVIGAYTLFVGAEAPVVRAAIMASVFLLAGALGRRTSAAPAIALAAALLVAVSPQVVDDLSFQLSFAATTALALIAAPAYERAAAAVGLTTGGRSAGTAAASTLLETVIISAAAVAATLPLIALHFGRISLVALPANLLVVPTFPFIFLGSLATAIAGAIAPGLGEFVGWIAAWLPLSWFVEVAQWSASLPFASANIDGFRLEHAAALYAALIGLAVWLRGTRRRRPTGPSRPRLPSLDTPFAWTALGVLIAVNVVVWTAVTADDSDALQVHALDVGQGDAILVIAPSGHTLLIDGGPDGRLLLRELSNALPPGRRTIDVVVATHPQADHVNGLFALFDRYRIGRLLVSPVNDRTDIGRRLSTAAAAGGVSVQIATAETLLTLGTDVLVDVLPANSGRTSIADVNSGTVVLRIRHGEVAFLFTGDIEAAQELTLAQGEWDLSATVLKVAHHGSNTSTTDLLLRRVRPGLALISVGDGNGFGHPHTDVLERLSDTLLLRTDEQGTITLFSDGTGVRYQTAR